MEPPTRFYSVTIPSTQRCTSSKLFKSSYTLYEVRLNFPSDSHIAQKRYSEFHDLKSSIDARTLLPLPEFPSKTLNNLSSKVVKDRREMLETWLQAVIQQEQLLPYVFKFLDVTLSRMSFVMNMLNSVSTPVDDAIVLDLSAQLSSEARQKLKALEHFDKVFFEQRRRLSEQSIQTVLAHLLPLCADSTAGAKSMYILSKLISPQHNRGYELFLHSFLRENTELLNSMQLHLHIRQKFPGDTAQFAFEILTVLHEYYERTNQLHSLHNILNYDTKALEIFNLRKAGDFEVKEKPQPCANTDWLTVENDMFPSINFKYKLEDGKSYLKGSMVVNASVDRILNALTSLDERRKWDLFYDGGRVLEVISETESIVQLNLNYEVGKVSQTSKWEVKRVSSSSASFSVESVVIPDAILPPGYDAGAAAKGVYTIETSKEPINLFESNLSTSPASSDNEQEDIEAVYSDSEVVLSSTSILNFEIQYADTTAFTTAALEGRLILVSWSRLKALVENQMLEGSKGSISYDTLQDSVQRKHLKSNLPMSLRSSLSD